METALLIELLGYAASLLVAVSLMMRSVLKLRLINLLGAVCFTVYGLLIGAYPVAGVNGLIILINLYYLAGMRRRERYFSLLDVRPDSPYLQTFLGFYEQDIRRFFPEFSYRPGQSLLIWFILRDVMPVGLFIGERQDSGVLRVQLDYVIPGYRDLQPARFLYGTQAPRLRALGIERIAVPAGSREHQAYLRRLGFEPAPHDGGYSLRLPADG